MSNHRENSDATGDDLISKMPDQILLSILQRLSSAKEAARTTVLSKRWRSPWQSYPFVVFDVKDLNRRREAGEISSTAVMARLRQFGDATSDRFSRDKNLMVQVLKVDFSMSNDEDTTSPWFVGLKNFVTTCTQFNMINILWCRSRMITFEEADNVHPRAIEHLQISSELSTSNEQRALLDGLFWACRPRFLTFVHFDSNGSKKLTQVFSDLTSKYLLRRFSEDGGEGFDGDRSWLHQLKDVKMIMRLRDVKMIMQDTEMVKKYVRQVGEWEHERRSKVRTCFELTWD
ncbi:Putative F-box protein At1g67390 [Linum perenne]